VGASMGLVPITSEFADIAEILQAADSACYMAKEQGRNRVQIYSEDDADLARRRGEMDWVSHISGALAEGRFRLRVQPVLSISDSQPNTQYCELLVNMVSRDGEIIPPNAFLPAAERYNLAARIDRWVLTRALTWLANDDDGRGRPEICGVNLSAQSLSEVGFLEFIRSECLRFNVPARQLCFEITETAAIGNLDTAIRFMQALKSDGARFALDDFGKGLSSFGYLRTLPVDYIKIDAQFVRDVVSDPIDRAMVQSINEVARIMDKRTIAEGVESNDVLGVLREIGVDLAQGFAIGTPQFID
jgi:EAL domain-containing protein (putative c-di-GMP-specific phosphodiesterase class I)